MYLRPIVFVTTFLLLTAALLAQWRAGRSTGQIQAASATLAEQQASASARLKLLTDKVNLLEQQLSEPLPASRNPSKPKEPARAPAPIKLGELIDTDPQLQILQQKAKKATFNATYAAFLRKHLLSPEKRAAFEELVLRHDEELNDLWSAGRRQNLDYRDSTMKNLGRQLNDAYNGEMEALLGKPGFQDWQEYEKTTWLRDMVSGLAGAATLNGKPFSPEQSEQLIQLMAKSSPVYPTGQMVPPHTIDWEVVDAQAAVILSPEQFTAFKTIEPRGPKGAGARGLILLNAAINQAYAADQGASSRSAAKKN